jgi:cytochrome c biogenesis protein CcmG, thiol:disulfide interchange protein DsbE
VSGQPVQNRADGSKGGRRSVPLAAIALGAAVLLGAIVLLLSRTGSNEESEAISTEATESSVEFGTPQISGTALAELTPEAATGAAPDPAVGQAAPGVSGQSPIGTPASLSTGAPHLVLFLAHWCPHCNDEADALRAEIAGGLDPSGIEIVLTGSSPDRANWPPSAWLAGKGLGDLPTLVDDQNASAARAYGLSGFPFIVGVRADGTVAFRASGEQAEGYFATSLRQLRAA